MKNKMCKEMYCQFLLAAQGNFTMTAMAETLNTLSHDKINRWASETKLTPAVLWEYSSRLVEKKPGYLICDDVIIEKDYGKDIELTGKQYSSSDKKYVNGIDITTVFRPSPRRSRREPEAPGPLLAGGKGFNQPSPWPTVLVAVTAGHNWVIPEKWPASSHVFGVLSWLSFFLK